MSTFSDSQIHQCDRFQGVGHFQLCRLRGQVFSFQAQEIKVTQLQEMKKLVPTRSHPAHVLTYGMLLPWLLHCSRLFTI